MLQYELTREQYSELAGLAFHRASDARNSERDDLNAGEREQDAENVKQHFHVLDALGVPYWVQNVVLLWSENWRRYERSYLREYLKQKNITVRA